MEGQLDYYNIGRRRKKVRSFKKKKQEKALTKLFLTQAFVLLMSNILVSSLRNFIPKQVRIASFILIIATFVTITDYVIQAISVELHKSLGAFISLIVVNCLILSRAEAFASKNTIGLSSSRTCFSTINRKSLCPGCNRFNILSIKGFV